MNDLPKLRIKIPGARAYLTSVELDGRVLPATRVSFDTGPDLNSMVKVRLEFYAEIELDATVPLAVTDLRPVEPDA